MKTVLISVFLLTTTLPASAAQGSRWYLRYDTDNGPMGQVYKSKAACEAGIRYLKKINIETRRDLDRYFKSIGTTFEKMNPNSSRTYARNPRCLNRLPHGFLPPG